jgi:hypothetical protein
MSARGAIDLHEIARPKIKEILRGKSRRTKMYFAPLIEGNGPMVNRMAEQLEPLNREGAILLGSVP